MTYYFISGFCFRIDADRAASITVFGGAGGGGQHLHSCISGNGDNASNFYPDSFAAQHRHQLDGGLQFSSGYPGPIAPESQPAPMRLQSPPHCRLNHRNRNAHRNQQYESGTSPYTYYNIVWIHNIILYCIVAVRPRCFILSSERGSNVMIICDVESAVSAYSAYCSIKYL